MTDHRNIATALAAFQAEMPSVRKSETANAGQYAYTYADLAGIMKIAAPLLAKHGLAFSCSPAVTEHGPVITGCLMHVSGEILDGTLPLWGSNPQQLGSSITYGRRYLLGALTGIVTDDDDDAAAAIQAPPRKAPAKKASVTPAQIEAADVDALRALWHTATEAGDAAAVELIEARVAKLKESAA